MSSERLEDNDVEGGSTDIVRCLLIEGLALVLPLEVCAAGAAAYRIPAPRQKLGCARGYVA